MKVRERCGDRCSGEKTSGVQLLEKSGDRLTGCCIRAQNCERGQKTA